MKGEALAALWVALHGAFRDGVELSSVGLDTEATGARIDDPDGPRAAVHEQS